MKTKKTFDSIKDQIANSKKTIKKLTSKIKDYREKKTMELFKSGMRLFKLGQREAALKDLKKALRLNAKSNKSIPKENIAYAIAQVYNCMNHVPMELKFYTIAIRHNPYFYDAWFEKGVHYLLFGKNKREDISLKGRWGRTLTNSKRFYQEALYCFKKAEKADPRSAQAMYYVGYTYELLNKPKKAMEIFDMVLGLESNFDNIEKSELFKKVKNEPRKIVSICPKCNSKIEEADVFCPNCGKKIEKE